MKRPELEEAWPVDEPPRDFAERVVGLAVAERRKRGQWRHRAVFGLVAALAAAAALVLWLRPRAPASGDVVAQERTELDIGRAKVVLEPGSHIAWHGDEVGEDRGNVFYRVEPGGRFVVKTPRGDIAVLGTCFRVQVGARAPEGASGVKKRNLAIAAGGAALSVVAVVTVYEGKVELSRGDQRLALAAGESGSLGEQGVKRLGDKELGETRQALDDAKQQPNLERANDALASDIADLDRKLHGIEKEKAKLEQQLADTRTELARRTDAAIPRDRNEFDLDKDDWQALAKDGTVKYRLPCLRPGGWKPSSEALDALGLAPDDAATLQTAYQNAYDRVWKTIRPLCAKAIGNADVVDTLGPDTCTHVVVDAARKQDGQAVSEAMREVDETRAGLRPAAAPATADNPVFQLFWALTGEMPAFEKELAQSFGPEEAKRLAYSKEICAGENTFGGPGPRKPGK